jgi:Xaa-Pro aminopeptidase
MIIIHKVKKLLTAWIFGIIVSFLFCTVQELEKPFPTDKNPWHRIRKERIGKLLPEAMKLAEVDAWIVFCREIDNDPLAKHVGGENATGTAAFVFFLDMDKVKSVAISPQGDAKALQEAGLHDEVIVAERYTHIWDDVALQIKKEDPERIAVNSSGYFTADGLSYTQRNALEKELGGKYARRLVSSTDLVMEWLSVKLPEEIEIMKKAAELTAQLQIEAYNTIIPGQTKDADVAKFLKRRMKEIDVSNAWAPEQNPNVNSGPDRGHSHATDKIIQPGDVIQIDFGIKVYDTWCTDIQRFAYVLKGDEKAPPAEIQNYFQNAKEGHRKVLTAMKPGVNGWTVDKVQREWLEQTGSLPVMWGTGHPVGYWAHDAGPSLGGAAHQANPSGNNARVLRTGQTFAYDGFFTWEWEDGTTKTISVEEMAVVGQEGSTYMVAPQEEWILISSH